MYFSIYLGCVGSPLTVLCPSLSFLPLCVSQIQSLVTDSAGHKLLVLSGQSSDHGALLLQTGVFTSQTFSRVFTDPGVSHLLFFGNNETNNNIQILHSQLCVWLKTVYFQRTNAIFYQL